MLIAVLGAGSWGTALALHLSKSVTTAPALDVCANGPALRHTVTLFDVRSPGRAAAMCASRENAKYLPGIPLPPQLLVRGLSENCLLQMDMVIIAVPSQYVRALLEGLQLPPPPALLVCASKGLEERGARFLTMDAVIKSVLPDPSQHGCVCVLGGPSFASEVARGLPTAVVLAAPSEASAARAAAAFHGGLFRAYTSLDTVGVEVGAALKNVIAIAVGVSDGAGMGANARAALITRGLGEVTRIALALGASPLTLLGLAGLGDLVLTCTCDLSRNRRVGLALGQGRTLASILEELGQVAEGVTSCRAGHALAKALGVEAPLIGHVFSTVQGGKLLIKGVK